MQCDEARLILWPEPGPRAAEPEVVRAFDHYGSCASCKVFFEIQQRLAERLKDLKTITAPLELRERVFATLAEERLKSETFPAATRTYSPGTRVRNMVVAIAATIVLAVGGTLWQVGLFDRGPAAAVTRLESTSISDTHQLSRWIGGKIGYQPHIPSIPDARITGGAILVIRGIPSAAVTYRLHGEPVTYYVVPFKLAGSDSIDVTDDLMAMSEDGIGVVTWEFDGSARAISAALPHSRLAFIARLCQKQEPGIDHRG